MTEQKDSMFQPLPQGLYGDESMDNVISRDFGLIQDGLDFIGAFGKVFGDSNRESSGKQQKTVSYEGLEKRQKPLLLQAWEFAEITESLIADYDKLFYLLKSGWSSLSDAQKEQMEVAAASLRERLKYRDEKLSWQANLYLLIFSILKGKNIRKAFFDNLERVSNLVTSTAQSWREFAAEVAELRSAPQQDYDLDEPSDELELLFLKRDR